MKPNIILCGLQKCGKTTIGKILSETLKWNFIDTDQLIEERHFIKTSKKASCRKVYQEEGSAYFRALEKQAIFSLKEVKAHVIAIGGGSLLMQENVAALKLIGHFVYLKAPTDLIWKRMEDERIVKDETPAYLDQNSLKNSFYKNTENRLPIYENTADYTVETHNFTEIQISSVIAHHFLPIHDDRQVRGLKEKNPLRGSSYPFPG